MDYLTILAKKSLQMPFQNEEVNFQKHIERRTSVFLKEIKKIDQGSIVSKLKKAIPRIEKLITAILEANELYNQGRISDAYVVFRKELNKLKRVLLYDRMTGRSVITDTRPLFRSRIGGSEQFSLPQIFHVPFEKRNFISTARYSLPGMPCLYGANSTYLCWIEMKKPELRNIQFSQLKWKGKRNLFVLDLSQKPDYIVRLLKSSLNGKYKEKRIKELNMWNDWIISTFMKWPIQLVTSTVVKNRSAPHKPEYVFPQFLMQWITEQSGINGVDGIKYFSVSGHKFSKYDYGDMFNYAIPVKSNKDKGHCDYLTGNFELTYPVSWNSLFNSKPQIISKTVDEILEEIKYKTTDRPSIIEINKGETVPYWKTIFGLLEMELAKHKYYKIE